MTDETIIDLNAARLDRGLPMVPVTFAEHLDHLDNAVHKLVHLAINGADDDETYQRAEADCAAAIEAVEHLPREEPADAEQTRALREQLAALPALVAALMRWVEIGDYNGDTCRIEGREAADEALRLIGRLETFGVADDADDEPEIEPEFGAPLLALWSVKPNDGGSR